jgi:AraC-like DNA-binding protein
MEKIEQFKAVCDDVETATGIKTVLFGADKRILHAQKDSMCAFCSKVRELPEMREACRTCDHRGIIGCEDGQEIHIYRCHMGLVEAVAPIMENGIPIAYLMFGQILAENGRDAVRHAIDRLPEKADKAALHKLLTALPETSESRIRAAARVLAMCASYVHLKAMISAPREDPAHRVAAFITAHLSDPALSVSMLCTAVGLSRTALYEIFRQTFGKGIRAYIHEKRAREAHRLLQGTDHSVERIAAEVGLRGRDQLTALLKRIYGKSPRQIRKDSHVLSE